MTVIFQFLNLQFKFWLLLLSSQKPPINLEKVISQSACATNSTSQFYSSPKNVQKWSIYITALTANTDCRNDKLRSEVNFFFQPFLRSFKTFVFLKLTLGKLWFVPFIFTSFYFHRCCHKKWFFLHNLFVQKSPASIVKKKKTGSVNKANACAAQREYNWKLITESIWKICAPFQLF